MLKPLTVTHNKFPFTIATFYTHNMLKTKYYNNNKGQWKKILRYMHGATTSTSAMIEQ